MRRYWLVPIALLFGSLAASQEPRVLRTVVAPAETLQVSVWGKGEPVVIVPGIWSSTYAFRKVIPQLAEQGLEVIVIEPLGVASSGRPQKADYSMTAQARRIGAVLDSLHVHDALFVGQALSTAMLLRLAIQSPDRVRGIVSLEGGAAESSSTPGLRMGLAVASVLFKIIPSRGLIRRRVRSDLENVSGDRSWITSEVVDGYVGAWSRNVSETLGAYRAIARSKEPEPLAPRLNEVRVSLQLLVGTAPHYGGVQQQNIVAMERLQGGFAVARIAGAGHLIHEERPEEVTGAVMNLRQRLARLP